MAHLIEAARSGRSTCRTCHQLIVKGALRFGFETEGFDEGKPSHIWHHLDCAARRMPNPLREALASYSGEIPNRPALEALLAAGPGKAPGGTKAFPFAERATTGRAKCMECEEPIEKGTFRIGVERDIEVMGVTRKGPGYYHLGCAAALGEGLFEKLKAHSQLSPAELEEVASLLG